MNDHPHRYNPQDQDRRAESAGLAVLLVIGLVGFTTAVLALVLR